jgi:hypothetical protein
MKKQIIAALILPLALLSCREEEPATASGSVSKKTVEVATDGDGWTTEQKNIAERLRRDNKVGAIKHLYVISPYSGQVLLYSTVKGKVTSSGKRLTPNTIATQDGEFVGSGHNGSAVTINGQKKYTGEVLQDDGSYGSSCEYIYWFDSKDVYHSHFFTGGQIIHVSEQPIATKNIVLNLEQQ